MNGGPLLRRFVGGHMADVKRPRSREARYCRAMSTLPNETVPLARMAAISAGLAPAVKLEPFLH
jgi:hypothetical protein